jgi:hypothetical protein
MFRFRYLAMFVLLVLPGLAEDQSSGEIVYAQVIRGTDDATVPVNWKPIGPKLGKTLAHAFKWHAYWEVKRETLTLSPAKPARVRVSDERELRVELLPDGRLDLHLYTKDKLRQKKRTAPHSPMAILGGDAENGGWFVVVRRDKPATD